MPGLEHPGFPIAEVAEDGSAVITKHPGTGGLVSVGTVTAQLLYEIGGPLYANPDVVADFSTIRLEQVGPDRVRVSGVAGPARPREAQGVDQPAGRVAQHHDLRAHRPRHRGEGRRWCAAPWTSSWAGPRRFADYDVRLIRTDVPDAPTNEQASAQLRVTVKDPDPDVVGRRFSNAATELALASYPGFYLTVAARRGHRLRRVLADAGARATASTRPSSTTTAGAWSIAPAPDRADRGRPGAADAGIDARRAPAAPSAPPTGPRRAACRSGTVIGARSGDKGGNANVGLWARSPAAFAWLARRAHRRALPAAAPRGRRPRGRPLRAAQPAGPQLRGARAAGRGRGLVDPARPPGQEPGRVPALAPGRRARGAPRRHPPPPTDPR